MPMSTFTEDFNKAIDRMLENRARRDEESRKFWRQYVEDCKNGKYSGKTISIRKPPKFDPPL